MKNCIENENEIDVIGKNIDFFLASSEPNRAGLKTDETRIYLPSMQVPYHPIQIYHVVHLPNTARSCAPFPLLPALARTRDFPSGLFLGSHLRVELS